VTRRARLVLARAAAQAIVRHARAERPKECCGFLVGSRGRARFAVAATNVAAGTTRYRIDDAWHVELRRTLRRFSPPLEIVGVYHSHPSGDARPSPTDMAEALYPDWTHVIVGMERGISIRGYRIRDGRAESVVIQRESGDSI
jgi:proteasome lid subunit RPN8/RPN11